MRTRIHLEAVVFDMDGLLLDTEPIHRRAWQRAAAELGRELSDELYLRLVGLSDRDGYAILVDAFGSGFSVPAFAERWPRHCDDIVAAEGVTPKPGLAALIAELDRLHTPYAIATSSGAARAERSLSAAGLTLQFPVRVTGDRIPNGKPAPDIYLEAARRLGVAPKRCLALEDSDPGLIAAVSAGMTGLLVPDLKPPSPEVRERAYRVLGSLDDALPLVASLLTAG